MSSPPDDFEREVDWAIVNEQEDRDDLRNLSGSDMQIDEEPNYSREFQHQPNEDEENADEIADLSQRVEASLHGSPRCSQNRHISLSQRSRYGDGSHTGNQGEPQEEPDDVPCSQRSHVSSVSGFSTNSMFSGAHRDRSERDDISEVDSTSSQRDPAHPSSNLMIANFRIPDSIHDCSRFSFPFTRFWDPHGHLVVNSDSRKKLYSHGKMLGIVSSPEKNPHYGVSWSFVDELTGLGLTDYLMSVIYFFNIIRAMSHHHPWNGFVTTTNNLKNNLFPRSTPGKKDVDGVLCGTMMDNQASSSSVTDSRIVNLDKLLDAGERGSSGMVYQAMPLLEIHVGFTGATYTVNSKQTRSLFGVVTVSWLLNVDFMPLFLVSFTSNHCFPNSKFFRSLFPQAAESG